jgi:uncharacterized membrane protein
MMWVWILIFGALVYLGYNWYSPREHTYRRDPLEIARERLARGEITPEEYEKIRAKLRSR